MKITNLTIQYQESPSVIDNENLEFFIGLNALIGQSGSGKSSILNVLSGNLEANYDSFIIGKTDIAQLDKQSKRLFLRQHVTYLSQSDNFIADLSCYDNLMLQAKLSGKIISKSEIDDMLSRLNLNIDCTVFPNQLSGGEKQKLAICSALFKDSEVVLCDEITSALDSDASKDIVSLLNTIAGNYKKIIVITSHDANVFHQCQRIIEIKNGHLTVVDNHLNENENIVKKDIKLLKWKDLKSYVFSKIDRNKWYYIFSSLIFGIVSAISCVALFFSINFIHDAKLHTALLSKDELFVVNKSIYSELDTLVYDANDLLIDQSIISNIQNLKQLKKAYPYFVSPLSNTRGDGEIILKGDNDSQTVEVISGSDLKVVPYYEQQHFEKKHTIINLTNENGYYVTRDFIDAINFRLQAFGKEEQCIDYENLPGKDLEVLFYIPVAYTKGETTYSDHLGTMAKIETNDPILVPVTLTLPISGIVENNYHDYTSSPSIYAPFELLEQLQNQQIQQYILGENELAYQPNALYCYSVSEDGLEELSMGIRQIDNNLKTQNRYQSLVKYQQSNRLFVNIAEIGFVIILVFGSILSYAYGIMYYNKNKHDYAIFKKHGILKKEISKVFIGKICIQTFINVLIALPITLTVVSVLYRIGYVSLSLSNNTILIGLLIFIAGYISLLTVFTEIKSYK